jgi:uncharacterized protein YbaR (Trm112 family)
VIKTDPQQHPRLSDILVEVLVCPVDLADLIQLGDELVCEQCGQRFPIANGVPNMLLQAK